MSQITVYAPQNGDVVVWPLKVCAPNVSCTNVQISFAVPSGVSITGPLVVGSTTEIESPGWFDLSGDLWYVGDVDLGECIELNLEFTVTDNSQKDGGLNGFIITSTATSDCASPVENASLLIKIEDAPNCIVECGEIAFS